MVSLELVFLFCSFTVAHNAFRQDIPVVDAVCKKFGSEVGNVRDWRASDFEELRKMLKSKSIFL
jgi:hypothetical protein